jgi:hypothetical protein
LRAYVPRIHVAGGELVIVGNGAADQVRDFIEQYSIATPVFTDPSLSVYRAVGARRGGSSLRVALNALRATRRGFFQWRVLGDPRQHGGVFVVSRGGGLAYGYVSAIAGDHPDPEEVVAALERVARE